MFLFHLTFWGSPCLLLISSHFWSCHSLIAYCWWHSDTTCSLILPFHVSLHRKLTAEVVVFSLLPAAHDSWRSVFKLCFFLSSGLYGALQVETKLNVRNCIKMHTCYCLRSITYDSFKNCTLGIDKMDRAYCFNSQWWIEF